MPAEKTRPAGYQNPPRLSPRTRTLISYHELNEPSGLRWVFMKHQCLHCVDARCATVCAPQAYSRTAEGVVVCDSSKCVACAACIDECPFAVPTLEYLDLDTPRLVKCDWCLGRGESAAADGAGVEKKAHPACARACPTGAIQFGNRIELLAEAHRRIAASPTAYVDHVYGERELGGTGWVYLSPVPFEKLELPLDFAPAAEPKFFGQSPGASPALALAAGLIWFCQRRDDVAQRDRSDGPSTG